MSVRQEYLDVTPLQSLQKEKGKPPPNPPEEFKPPPLRVVSAADLLAMDFPPRHNLLSPWLPQQGLAMVYAMRGIGKTHLSLGVAYAVASGSKFLGWQAPEPAGVLFLDGEMPGVALQERLAYITATAEREPAAPFRFLTPDLQEGGMPDLASEAGQEAIDGLIDDNIKLIVVDNLSTLVRSGKENEGDSWQPVQTWALRHRAKGRSVLFIHHAGKGGQQRGTSRREDVLDTVILLKRPTDYTPEQGARFEVHFEKARGIHGEDVQPIEARLITDADGRLTWSTQTLDDTLKDRITTMLQDGMSQADIARDLGVNRSTVCRWAKHAKQAGAFT